MQAAILPKLATCRDLDECRDRLMSLGGRWVGGGYFAQVYTIEVVVMPPMPPVGYVPDSAFFATPVEAKIETRVIKLARHDTGGLVAARAAVMTHEVDPYAPVYYGFKALDFGYNWIGELEYLTHTDANLSGAGGHATDTQHVTGDRYNRKPLDSFMETSPYLRECAIQYQHEMGHEDVYWDIHGSNIMMRGSQPVITDPISVM